MNLGASSAVLCFGPPKKPLAVGEIRSETEVMGDASFSAIFFSAARRWAIAYGVRGAAGDNRLVDPIITCSHTKQV
jgi:hypothetical protein